MSKQYWVAPVAGGIEPEPLIGPFDSYEDMVIEARRVRREQDEDDSLFYVAVGDGGPELESFCAAVFMDDE